MMCVRAAARGGSGALSQAPCSPDERRPPPRMEARQTHAREGAPVSEDTKEASPHADRRLQPRIGARQTQSASSSALGQEAAPYDEWVSGQRLGGPGGRGTIRAGRSHKPPPGEAVCGPKLQAKAALALEAGTRPREAGQSAGAVTLAPHGSNDNKEGANLVRWCTGVELFLLKILKIDPMGEGRRYMGRGRAAKFVSANAVEARKGPVAQWLTPAGFNATARTASVFAGIARKLQQAPRYSRWQNLLMELLAAKDNVSTYFLV